MPKIINKEEKTAEISEAALKVFRERGFSRTRMEDIANAAGIGKGTIYEYFKNKVDILHYVVDQFFNAFSQELINVVAREIKPAEKLMSFINFSLSNITEWEDHCAIYIEYFSSIRNEEEKFLLSSQYEGMKEIIINLIGECQASGDIDRSFDPEVVAELLVSIYDGLIVHRMLEGKKIEMELLRKTSMMVIERGLFNSKSK
jgi:TetR/AcrR family transcriptional regulator, repressor for uid operon